MHVSGESNPRFRRRPVALVLLVVLLGAVAIASTGNAPVGSGGARRPSQQFVDAFASLFLLLMAIGTVTVLYVMFANRHTLAEQRARARKGKNPFASLIALVLVALMIVLLVRSGAVHRRDGNHRGRVATPAKTQKAARSKRSSDRYEPRFATVPVLIVLGIAGAGLLAAALAYRARPRPAAAADPSLALQLADVLGETLDDLRAEPDPRKAVIAAYARLERTLAAFGLPRRESEAPEEYLHRILVDLEVGSRPAARLTELFARAKFSTGAVGPKTKLEAISLLESIRADLAAATPAEAPPPVRELPSAWGQTG